MRAQQLVNNIFVRITFPGTGRRIGLPHNRLEHFSASRLSAKITSPELSRARIGAPRSGKRTSPACLFFPRESMLQALACARRSSSSLQIFFPDRESLLFSIRLHVLKIQKYFPALQISLKKRTYTPVPPPKHINPDNLHDDEKKYHDYFLKNPLPS